MIPSIVVHRWRTLNDEALSEEAIRARFPSEKYRVSLYRYPSKARFDGEMRQATCHVLSGVCRYLFKAGVEATVGAGDVAELPAGCFTLEVLGDDDLVLVLCWALPIAPNGRQ